MSIASLTSARTPIESRRSAARQTTPSGDSFQARLASASAVIQGPAIHLRMPREGCVFSGAHAGRNQTMQEIYAEYTADSTAEDPIVRVWGTSDSGAYDFTCHVKEIDPSNASYAELAALFGHLEKSGAVRGLSSRVIPTGLETGDITERRDYLGMISRHQSDRRFGGNCKAEAAELLALYQDYASGTGASGRSVFRHESLAQKEDLLSALGAFQADMLDRMKLGKEKEEEKELWEKLMKYLDAWIESLREDGADIEKSARAYAALSAELTEIKEGRKDLDDRILEKLEECFAG